MIVRCPQCQYANQAEADATKPRIVCARCATVISLEFLASPSVPSVSDLAAFDLPASDSYAQGRPSSEPSFMKTPESPLDLDSLLDPAVDSAPLQSFAAPPAPPVPSQPLEGRWDADEILDIPRASAAAESHHDPLAVEDLLATTPLETDTPDGFAESVFADSTPLADSAAAAGGVWGNPLDDASEMVTDQASAFDESPRAQFANEGYAEAASEPELEPSPDRPSVFAQDSYTRSPASTYVMATPDGSNKGRLAKIFLFAALAFALLGVGYFALSGLFKDWLGARKSQQAAITPGATPGAAATTANKPGTTPSVAPLGTKAGTEANNASASPSASASVVAGAKPSATATPAPTNQTATSKPTLTPAPPPTGTSGPAVGAGEGSLTIQLGAYKSLGEAQQRVAKLKAAGIEGRVIKAEVPGKGTWYRVQSGRFTNEAEASKHAGELRAKGVAQDFIVTGYQNQ